MSKILGETPEPRVTGVSIDQKGVARMTVLIPMVVRAGADGIKIPVPGTYPKISGYSFAGASAKENPGGSFSWEITYEGPGPLDNGQDAEEEQTVYAFEPADSEIPITSHPDILKFIKDFKGRPEDGRVVFGVEVKKNATAQEIVGANKANPFFGVEAYSSFGGTWTKSYLVRNAMPSGLFDDVEKIVQTVPMPKGFKLPPIGTNRNWLKRMPSLRIRGKATEVTERYILSGRGGHNKAIYTGKNG